MGPKPVAGLGTQSGRLASDSVRSTCRSCLWSRQAGSVEYFPLPQESSWISTMDLEVRNILGYDTTRSGDRTLAESYPGTKNRHRPHPGAISKDDRTHHQVERWVRPIMISRAQIGALGDADVFTDFHECHVVNPTILAEPGILPN